MTIAMRKIYQHDGSTEFESLEAMIQLCAASAVRDTRRAWKNGKTLIDGDKIDLNFDLVNKLIKSYKESTFGKGFSTAYIKRVKEEFLFLINAELKHCCHSQEHYNLILPVIFFRCIMQDEFNHRSAKIRESELDLRASEPEESSEEQWEEIAAHNKVYEEDDKDWIKRERTWTRNYDSGKLLSVELYQMETQQDIFHDIIREAEDLAISRNFKANGAIPAEVRIACEGFFQLKDKYEIVKKYSENAKVGCFLYDLLQTTADIQRPLDTILRLYMIAEVHDVLSYTGHLIRGEAYAAINAEEDKEQPLKQFVEESRTAVEPFSSVLPCFIKPKVSDSGEETSNKLKKIKAQKRMFMEFYDYLYKTYEIEDINILDFCLDKDVLEPRVYLDKTIIKYIRSISSLIKLIPRLEDTVAQAKTAIRMTNLFREDKIVESWEHSNEHAMLLEAKELLDM